MHQSPNWQLVIFSTETYEMKTTVVNIEDFKQMNIYQDPRHQHKVYFYGKTKGNISIVGQLRLFNDNKATSFNEEMLLKPEPGVKYTEFQDKAGILDAFDKYEEGKKRLYSVKLSSCSIPYNVSVMIESNSSETSIFDALVGEQISEYQVLEKRLFLHRLHS